jgi:hypothetical protein
MLRKRKKRKTMAIIDMTDEQKTAVTKMRERESNRLDPQPEKNIIFIGDGDPPLSIHGVLKAELPDAETQKRGFYHERAREIVSHFPRSYKRMVKLGDK